MTVLEPIIQYLSTLPLSTITLKKITQGAGRPRKPVLRVMDRLAREGYLEEIADTPDPRVYRQYGRDLRNPTWKILKSPLLEDFVPRPERNTDRDKMWRVIRAKRRFSKAELERIAEVKEGNCSSYVNLLLHHGFLRKIAKDGRQQVYLLIKDPGPKRPVTPERKKKRSQNNAQ